MNLRNGTRVIGTVFIFLRLAFLTLNIVPVVDHFYGAWGIPYHEDFLPITATLLFIFGAWILFDIGLVYGATKEENTRFHTFWSFFSPVFTIASMDFVCILLLQLAS